MVGLFLQIHHGQLARPHRAGKGHLAGQVSSTWEVMCASAEMGPADSSLAEQGSQRPHSSGLVLYWKNLCLGGTPGISRYGKVTRLKSEQPGGPQRSGSSQPPAEYRGSRNQA